MTDSLETESFVIIDGNCLPDARDRYVYPVVPGSAEWNSSSLEERENRLCQLPDDKLKSLSAYALIQSLLDKPLIWHNYLVSSNASAIGTCDNAIFAYHNSVPEFEKRQNRVEALMSYYGAVCLDCFESLDVAGRINFNVQLCVLEVWFTRDAILRSLNDVQKKQAVALLLQKYRQKQSYDGAGTDGSPAAMAWIMYDAQYPPVMSYYKNENLSKEWFIVHSEQIEDIISFAENYTR
jgi:hypothetical protein